MRKITLPLGLTFFLFVPNVYAYIGPGLGAGTIAVILGVIGSIFLGLFSILYYPIKRMRKKRKERQAQKNGDNT